MGTWPRVSVLAAMLLSVWCVGLFARGFWTPDEPREADLAWRMSWQSDKAVPLLAGAPFCEKPPLNYWVAGAAIAVLGVDAWAARLPNLLYALITALAVGALGRRSLGVGAGAMAAGCMATFLLSYQVAIWLATDAPLLAFDALALFGLYTAWHARDRAGRLTGYVILHGAIALGFLSKSAAAWLVPGLTLATLTVWERRWRELARWELYAPLLLQAAVVLPWVVAVYSAPDGLEHLRIFFWNNLAGRFVHLDAPAAIDYTSGHRNSPGKYFLELPMYLWPWTLLAIAALRRAWQRRDAGFDELAPVRFAIAATLPPLIVLSLAATARNIYVAPTLPGFALLIAWWGHGLVQGRSDRVDARLVGATALLLALGALTFAAASIAIALRGTSILFALLGLAAALTALARAREGLRRGHLASAVGWSWLAWCTLLVVPAAPLYAEIDRGQDLAVIGRAVRAAAAGRPLLLLAPDETTQAFVDLYAMGSSAARAAPDDGSTSGGGAPSVRVIDPPLDDAAIARLDAQLALDPRALVLVQVPGRSLTPAIERLALRFGLTRLARAGSGAATPPLWMQDPHLQEIGRYALPNGRRYALLAAASGDSR